MSSAGETPPHFISLMLKMPQGAAGPPAPAASSGVSRPRRRTADRDRGPTARPARACAPRAPAAPRTPGPARRLGQQAPGLLDACSPGWRPRADQHVRPHPLAQPAQPLDVLLEVARRSSPSGCESRAPGTRRPRASASSVSLMPMVIEVGSAACARPSSSHSGRPSAWACRSYSAMSTAARAAGVAGIRCRSCRASEPRPGRADVLPDQELQRARRQRLLAGLVGLAGHVRLGRGRPQPHAAPRVAQHHHHRLDRGHGAEGDGVRPARGMARTSAVAAAMVIA